MARKSKQRYFRSDSEVVAIRNNAGRLRPARISTERPTGPGRPKAFLPRKSSKAYEALLRYFFVPLVNALELGDEPNEKMSFSDRINFIFGSSHRDVVLAIATVNFTMPGVMWVQDQVTELLAPGPMDARILVGTTLAVRIDERTPDRIDIERCDSEKGVTFTLTKSQYLVIYKYMREVAGCNERLDPPLG